jgi:hypothetical protein
MRCATQPFSAFFPVFPNFCPALTNPRYKFRNQEESVGSR